MTRAENARRAVEDIASQLSISPIDAVPAKSISDSPSPVRSMTISKTITEPIYPKVAPPDSDEDIDNVSEDVKSTQISNLSTYYKALFLPQGLLFSSPAIQLGFQRLDSQFIVSVHNSTEAQIDNLSLDVVDAPKGED